MCIRDRSEEYKSNFGIFLHIVWNFGQNPNQKWTKNAFFLDIFDEDLANIIESVDLSTSPLSPLSGFQDILISLLRGINQLSSKRD